MLPYLLKNSGKNGAHKIAHFSYKNPFPKG